MALQYKQPASPQTNPRCFFTEKRVNAASSTNMGGNGDEQHQAKKATGKGATKGVQLKPRRRTYGGLGLMKRSTNENDGFGAIGEHKFAGKRRHSSPVTKPMRLSRRLSYAIAKR